MENPVTHYEQGEFQKLVDEKFQRLHDEDARLNKRVGILEETVQQLNNLTLSVQKLADNIEAMCKEQASMRETQEEESSRLRSLEDKDGERWRSFVKQAITFCAGIISALAIAYIRSLVGI